MLRTVFFCTVLIYLTFAQTPSILTSNAGVPIDDGRHSQTLGRSGPVLLQDAYLIERLAIQNRERIPERTVHARGTTAKGYFLLSGNVSNLTFADFLNGPGKKTPIALRFSTVIHGSSSPEFLRDPRGFAIKFYTNNGNYDITGLNFPVFFIRDSIRFPEMIRSLKPNPVSGVQEWWRIWDFFSDVPESTHMFTHLMDDIGIPASYREMDGWGVHTYKWINAKGDQVYVRYYFQSAQGVATLDDDEAVKMPFTFATTDLFDNLKKGNHPKWKVYYQTLPVQDSYPDLPFDPIDTTKRWPEDMIPYHELGELVLTDNVDNYFLENEQIAFSPGRLVPGIEPSNDKMLQGRLFAYSDTQRYRLGVNYQLLPVNSPKNTHFDNHHDGTMNFLLKTDEVNYFPSHFRQLQEAPKYPHDTRVLTGAPTRDVIPLTDDFGQAGDRYNSFDAPRQDRLAFRIAATLSGERVTDDLRNIWYGYWTKVDAELCKKIQHFVTMIMKGDPDHLIRQASVLRAMGAR